MTQVIIIGGGFGGINAAQALKRADVEILLLDRTNHHVFQPLLYQVATAALSVGNIASPIREILHRQDNVTVLMEQVDHIDKVNQLVHTANGDKFSYDYLIVAAGVRPAYFGHDQWESIAPGLKTVSDAVRVREEILLAFEKAERCEDPEKALQYLRFAIIGGGPTGVEMAGSIAEFAHRTLRRNFRRIKPELSKIYLIEGADQLLPSFPLKLAEQAKKDLENLGVEVLLNTIVTDLKPEGIHIHNVFIPVLNIIWAAGNQAVPLLRTLDVPLDKMGRVIVNPDMTIPDYSNIFVIGDAACFKIADFDPLPGVAPVAIQQARYVAQLIKKQIAPDQRKPFSYFDKGTIATIGRGKAVAMVGKLQFSGLIAWLIWCFIHIVYLVSFRYRLLILIQWFWLYIVETRQGRVITRSIDKILKKNR
jgi:NADH:ubiquinone reductase (H+-translocating)